MMQNGGIIVTQIVISAYTAITIDDAGLQLQMNTIEYQEMLIRIRCHI